MPEEWLSLSKAAMLLGVHPGTVRAWSDQGRLPVHRTEGGHRRYRRSEIELWLRMQNAEGLDAGMVMQTALRRTRFEIGEGRLAAEGWYQKLDTEAREQYARSGRSLLQGLLGYLASNNDSADAEARSLGYEYASRGQRYGLSNAEAVHAFLFFRNLLLEALLNVYETAGVRSPQAWGEMLRKVHTFTDRILTTLVETYDAYPRNGR